MVNFLRVVYINIAHFQSYLRKYTLLFALPWDSCQRIGWLSTTTLVEFDSLYTHSIHSIVALKLKRHI